MQGGWMKQFDYRINDETGRSFFSDSFSVRYPTKKENRRKGARCNGLIAR